MRTSFCSVEALPKLLLGSLSDDIHWGGEAKHRQSIQDSALATAGSETDRCRSPYFGHRVHFRQLGSTIVPPPRSLGKDCAEASCGYSLPLRSALRPMAITF